MSSGQQYIRLRILHIEDDKNMGVLVERILAPSPLDVQLERVPTLEDGLDRLKSDVWDLVLLDLTLPDSNPNNTFADLYSQYPYTPVVVLTGEPSLEIRAKAVACGAQDCLDKLEVSSPGVLDRSIRFAVERHRILLELREFVRELEEFKRQVLEIFQEADFTLSRTH